MSDKLKFVASRSRADSGGATSFRLWLVGHSPNPVAADKLKFVGLLHWALWMRNFTLPSL
jgi:hypothetical protein